MFLLTILIPVRDNAGVAFPPEAFGAFERLAVDLFGGMTRAPALAAGLWAQAGVLYTDDTRIYIVALSSITKGGEVAQLVAFAKVQFGQETIFIAYLGLAEIL